MKSQFIKRASALTLAAAIFVPLIPAAYADAPEDEALISELRSDTELYPDGAFAFYESRLTASEGDGEVYVDIVRRGSADGSAEVSFKAIDVSAEYGRDYTLSVEDGSLFEKELEQDADAVPLIELYARTEEPVEIGAKTEPEEADKTVELTVDADEGIISAEETEKEAKEEAKEEAEEEINGEEPEEEFSAAAGLKAARQVYTGQASDRRDWKEITGEESGEVAELAERTENSREYIERFASQLPGTEKVLKFKDGEYRKRVKVSLIDDDLSETDEQIIFALYDAENAELVQPFTAYLNITDNDESEPVIFYMPEREVYVTPDDAYAVVKVARQTGTDTFASVTVGTGAVSARAGEDYTSGSAEVIFPPGVSERTVKIPLLNAGRSETVNFVAAIDRDKNLADENYYFTNITLLPDNSEETLNSYIAERDAEIAAQTGEEAEARETDADSLEAELTAEPSGDGEAELMAEPNESGEAEPNESGEAELFADTRSETPNKTITSPDSGTNWSAYTALLSGLDLRNAASVKVSYTTSGSYTYNYKECKKKKTGTRYSKEIEIKVGGKSQTVYDNSQGVSGSVIITDFSKNTGQTAEARIKRSESGNKGTVSVKITRIDIAYNDIIVSVDNDQYIGYNTYVEKIYRPGGTSGTNQKMTYTEGNTLRLGAGMVNGENKAVASRYSQALTFSISAVDGQKTSRNIKPLPDTNVYLAGWQVYNESKNKYRGEIIPPSVMSLETLYSKYGAQTVYQIRPVIYPYASMIRFSNSCPEQLEYTNNISNGMDAGVTMLDTVELSAVGVKNTGYTVEAYSLKGYRDADAHSANAPTRVSAANKLRTLASGGTLPTESVSDMRKYLNSNADYASEAVSAETNTAEANKIVITPDKDAVYIDMAHTTPTLKVKYNPSDSAPRDYAAYGVVYSWDEDKGDASPGDCTHPLVIQPAKLFRKYKFNAIYSDKPVSVDDPPQETDTPTGIITDYTTVWQDFTGDEDGDGKLTPEEINALAEYKLERGASTGDTFAYTPKLINSDIYYYFKKKTTAQSAGLIDGTVFLRDYPIFGDGGAVNTPLNGASVSVDGFVTSTAYNGEHGGIDGKGGDGYFAVEDKSFISGESHRVTVNYGALSMAKTHYVNVADNYILDAYDTISVSDARIARGGDAIEYTDILNDDREYTITFVTASSNSAVVARKAVLTFCRQNGTYIASREYDSDGTNTGIFNCRFNPDKLNIPAGARIKVKFIDNEGTTYFEHDTGITIKQSLGKVSLLSSFVSGKSAALQVIGTVDSTFGFGWDGNLDNDTYEEEEGETIDHAKIGYSIKTENNTRTLNFGMDFSWDGDNDDDKKEDGAKAKLKEAAKSGDAEKQADAVKDKTKAASKGELALGYDVNLSFGLTLTLKTDETGENAGKWYFEEFMLAVEAGTDFSANYSFVTPIGIPVIVGIKIGVSGQAIMVVERRLGADEYYMTNLMEGGGSIDFVSSGEKELSDYFYTYGNFTIKPYIGLSGGLGTNKLNITLGGRADFTFNFSTKNADSGSVKFTCTLSVKILFFHHTWKLGEVAEISLFEEGAKLYDSLSDFEISDRPHLANRSEWNGKTGEEFGPVGAGGVSGIRETELMSGVNAHTDAKLLPFGDEKYIAVFTDDVPERSNTNSSAAYYTIYSDGEWSEPVILMDDGTGDDTPALYDLGNGKLFIAWSSANRIFGDAPLMLDTLNSRNIKGAFFDTDTQTVGEVFDITTDTDADKYADSDVRLAYDSETNRMLIYYTKSEYSSSAANGGEGLYGDAVYPYSIMTYRIYDLNTNEFVGYSAEEEAEIKANLAKTEADIDAAYEKYLEDYYGQRFLDLAPRVIVSETLDGDGYWTEEPAIEEYKGGKDPLIIESSAISYNGLALLAYLLDYDGSKETEADRDIFIQIYNFEENSVTHPIMIMSNDVEESNLRFGRAAGEWTYLSYLSDGNIKLFDITENLTNEAVIREARTSDGEPYYYIVKTAEAGYVPEAVMVSADSAGDFTEDMNITGFDMRSNDDYIYTMFTQRLISLKDGVKEGTEEASLAENNLVETQIFMTRFDMNNGVLTAPVQITNEEGANYSDAAFAVTGSGFTAIAAKSGSAVESIDGIDVSVNDENSSSLCALEFTPESVLVLRNAEITDIASGKNASASAELYNDGIETIDGVTVEIFDADGGKIETDGNTYSLIGGESEYISFMLPVAEDGNSCGFTIRALNSAKETIAELAYFDSEARSLDVKSFNAKINERGIITFNATVANNTTVTSGTKNFEITSGDKLLYSEAVDSLNAGESVYIEGAFEVDYNELFDTVTNSDGSVSAEAALNASASPDGTAAQSAVSLYASSEQMARFNAVDDVVLAGGKGRISIGGGDVCSLEPELIDGDYGGRYEDNNKEKIAPIGVKMIYESENEDIVKVYNGGFIEGVSQGTAKIKAALIPEDRASGEKTGDYPTLPDEAIRVFEIEVTVFEADAHEFDAELSIISREETAGAVNYRIGITGASKGTLVAASYDKDGRLYRAVSREISSGAGEVSVEVPSGSGNIRLALWDDIDGMKPLAAELTDVYTQ